MLDNKFVCEDPSQDDIHFLEDQLYEFNQTATGINDGRGLGIFLWDDSGNMLAGAAGYTWGGTCELRQVWVAQDQRGGGLGRRLLAVAEAEAILRGCTQIVVTTHSFQAPVFYRKLGYEVVSQIADYPRGFAQLILQKNLRPSPQ